MKKGYAFDSKGLFTRTSLMLVFLLCSVMASAEQVVVTLTEAGTLPAKIDSTQKYTITSLKVSGPINGTDVRYLREMAGQCIKYGNPSDYVGSTDGKLVDLDLADANIVSGGDGYYLYGNAFFYTEDNVFGQRFFCGCNLKNITLPKSLTSIGESAFTGCSGLTSIVIPNHVTSIGRYAFSECSNLASVVIPNSVTTIGYSAFLSCEKLTSIIIPPSVTSIECFAFLKSVKEVTLQGKTLPSASFAFGMGPNDEITVYCRACLIDEYKNNNDWKDLTNVKTRPFTITVSDAGIATGCFYDDLDFTNVNGLKAYIASGQNSSKGTVKLKRVNKVPAYTGFIVKGDKSTYEIPAIVTDTTCSNLLVGTLAETTLSSTDGSYTNYVLGKEDGKVGFYLPADNYKLPANKAYLRLPASVSGAKTVISINFDDDEDGTTDISAVKDLNDKTNGQTEIYNLNGQRKYSLSKGLNIVNGKKIFVK